MTGTFKKRKNRRLIKMTIMNKQLLLYQMHYINIIIFLRDWIIASFKDRDLKEAMKLLKDIS